MTYASPLTHYLYDELTGGGMVVSTRNHNALHRKQDVVSQKLFFISNSKLLLYKNVSFYSTNFCSYRYCSYNLLILITSSAMGGGGGSPYVVGAYGVGAYGVVLAGTCDTLCGGGDGEGVGRGDGDP